MYVRHVKRLNDILRVVPMDTGELSDVKAHFEAFSWELVCQV